MCVCVCVCVVSPQLASSSGILYFETSAESGENVQELFETLATEILDQVVQHFNMLIHACMHATPLPSCSLTSSERFVQGLQTHRHTQTRTDSLTHIHTMHRNRIQESQRVFQLLRVTHYQLWIVSQ